jgi:MFS superfamily sulfate permease-like transporter
MNDPYDRPRIYINWARVRPATWRDWLLAFCWLTIALAVLALVFAVASTLFIIGIVVSIVSAAVWFISSLFQRRDRNVIPYQDDDYA